MKKSVLASIKPKYCELIAARKKLLEIRKNCPKIDVPFKVYMYQTKGHWIYKILEWLKLYQGKVIGEFVCDLAFPINQHDIIIGCSERGEFELQDSTCLNIDELLYYLDAKDIIWGLHISELVIYDTPKELSEFGLTRPPQSWCYVEELEGLK